ncbi:hypothetical protein [Parvicella tangerina]|uniref:Lipoprotein n=1 Tax=Parvicella tangerina TaxID=2829795 RepID=A0A916N844_9FLAO|nr:hypothetical protein [Parvicella tangerina]CAG5076314.1 hypothetical protein CRYO30217_00061 [Parvicella tangerina]
MNRKNTLLVLGATIAMMSCSESKEEEKKELSFDEKVTAVCDCFDEKAETGAPPKDCFMLQGEYELTVEEDRRIEFIQTTNECAN